MSGKTKGNLCMLPYDNDPEELVLEAYENKDNIVECYVRVTESEVIENESDLKGLLGDEALEKWRGNGLRFTVLEYEYLGQEDFWCYYRLKMDLSGVIGDCIVADNITWEVDDLNLGLPTMAARPLDRGYDYVSIKHEMMDKLIDDYGWMVNDLDIIFPKFY